MKTKILPISTLAALLFCMGNTAKSQNYGKLCSLEMTADANPNPQQIRLNWPLRDDIKSYSLQRKAVGTPNLTVNLPATSTGYTDAAAQSGIAYEYKLVGYPLTAGNPTAYGDVLAGIEAPMVETRGGVLLVIASNVAEPLAPELDTLAADLVGDGWTVDRLTVAETDSPQAVKGHIVSRHAGNPALQSVMLIGHVPVPYSGNINPDGHTDHKGAWPCDGYYGDVVETAAWTDSTVNATGAARAETKNVPGDGKFDQSVFPSAVELSVGRIDFAELPSFAPLAEIDLLRRYFRKNHAFRTGRTTVAHQGLVDDNLSFMKEGLAASSRRAMVAGFGVDGAVDGDFLTHGTPSLLGCGVGYGSYSSIEGVATTSGIAAGSVNTVFNAHFGSYYGDWNTNDNVLRAVIAAEGVSLTSVWSGRPATQFYGMALGQTIGECVQAAMNQGSSAYLHIGYNAKSTHIALMGDPTLRLHPVAPASSPVCEVNGTSATLSWAPPSKPVVGYHIFRSDAGQPFTRRSTALVTGTTFSDTEVSPTTRYLVRSVKLEISASGSYFNGGTGVEAVIVQAQGNADPILAWKQQQFGTNSAVPAISGDFADADADGACNLLEYAMGTSPLHADVAGALKNVHVEGQGAARMLTGELCLCTASSGVRVTVQCSSDLQHWAPAPSPGLITTNGNYATHQVSVPATGDRCFFRVLVERI